MQLSQTSDSVTWYLEALADDRGVWRTEIDPFPFIVGRRENCKLRLAFPSISGLHAQFEMTDAGELQVEDLGSTNGTFVNLQRVEEPTAIRAGDVVHFADQEFRVSGQQQAAVRSTAAVSPDVIQAMRGAAERRRVLEKFIEEKHFQVLFQPIVSLESGATYAYEALGRSVAREVFQNVGDMFSEAKKLSLSLELSEALRFVSSNEVVHLPSSSAVFINTHPAELNDSARLLASLDRFLDSIDGRQVVMEVHEMAITNVSETVALRVELARRGVTLAFDDFGKGRSRFLELAELRPEFVKFDRATISGAMDKGRSRFDVISTLVEMVHKMGHRVIAEGIETPDELDFCKEIGFDYGQGYLLGRPRPADEPPTISGDDLDR